MDRNGFSCPQLIFRRGEPLANYFKASTQILSGEILIGTISAVWPGSDLTTPFFSKGQDHSHNIKHIRVRIQQTLLNIDISLRNEFYCFQRNRRRLFLGTQCDTGPEFGLICWLPISIPASMDICIFFGGVHIVYKTPCTTHFPIVSPCSRLNSSPSLTNSSFLLPSSGV